MPLILAGLCFLLLFIWDRLDWYSHFTPSKMRDYDIFSLFFDKKIDFETKFKYDWEKDPVKKKQIYDEIMEKYSKPKDL